jgi:putative glycosyltransferase (TIGR04372 family)
MPSMIESKNQICHKTFSEVDLEWKSKKLEPIIKVPNTDNEELIKIKNFFNISNGSKYICLNIRSTKYSKYNKFADSFRNGEIKDYESTINYLTELGYYVILLGENIEESHFNYSKPNMLINYSSCPIKSDKNDILIINNCELFIAAASGPQVIANSLNKKICFINAPFYNGFPCYKDSIFLPLKYYKNNKIVKIEEILKKYTNCFFKHMFDLNNLKIKKCSSNEILLTVKEFLFDNNIIKNFELLNNKNVNLFRKEFDVCNNKYNTKIYSKISAAYIVENYL